ncbi:hypothetical protein [Enterovibrio norvegicus]|uniref:Uncharacterized protein n=1 Tax=Enterovibrio norvegicus TaxID=188144 RepID=A0A2N7L726_9GAMM|nr:hypothetical protein [Enterovibrio norvegicus]PMN89774.1 hypothetical protein BCT23_21930 [Enterovibrio norvegicus]
MSRLFGQYLTRNLQGQQTLKPMIPSYYSGISAGMPSSQSVTATQTPSQGDLGQSEGERGDAFTSLASSPSSLSSNPNQASNVVAISPLETSSFQETSDDARAPFAKGGDTAGRSDNNTTTLNNATMLNNATTLNRTTEQFSDRSTLQSSTSSTSTFSTDDSLSQHGSRLAHSSSNNTSALNPIGQGSDGKFTPPSSVQRAHHDLMHGKNGNEDANVASVNTQSHQTSPMRGDYMHDVAASILSPSSSVEPSSKALNSQASSSVDVSLQSSSERTHQLEQAKQFAAKRRHAESNVSVNVTIGQVTVTASAQPQSSTHSPQHAARERPAWKPSLALSDYLRQREDGER